MRIVEFTDQVGLLAEAMGRPAVAVGAMLQAEGAPPARLIGVREGRAVGVVTARCRPDRRMFLHLIYDDLAAYRALVDAAMDRIDGPLYASVSADHAELIEALERRGFTTEVVVDHFEITFAAALSRLRRARLPAAFAVLRAAEADVERLVALDDLLRDDVPGTDGWRGSRDSMLHDIADPAAYLVARHEREYVGLVRIWDNPTGPRFGLLGVVPSHRRTLLAPALLRMGLEDAAAWGHESFSTVASPSNQGTYPAIMRLGVEPTGRTLQMVRQA